MKVYSWKTLLVSIVLGGGFFVFTILRFNGLQDFVQLIFLAYYIIDGLCVSFSEDCYKEYVKRVERGKRVNGKLFGKFAFLVRWGPMFFIVLGFCVVMLLPTLEWFLWLCLLFALASGIYISTVYRKHMKIEEEEEQIASEKPDDSHTI